jgi:phosphatidylserine/phosphatidylglycerophosphate/cardiolipin synthase-like enzyme
MPSTRPKSNPYEIHPSSTRAGPSTAHLRWAGLLFVLATVPSPGVASKTAQMAAIEICFAPETDCAAVAVSAIDRAQREILVGAYSLTTGAGIVEALLRAHLRGVDVRLIADKTTPCGRNSGVDPLAAAGVPVWIDHSARIAHAKTMVIDGALTLNGSYNWSRGAAANSEDLNLVASPVVAEAYATHWRDRQAVSLKFDRREDWCRAGAR